MIKYPPLLAQYNPVREELLDRVERTGIAQAKLLVRKDKSYLVGTIERKKKTNDSREYGSNAVYAKAQEYGLAKHGKPNYGFTPYLRPSAAKIIQKLASIIRGVF